MARYPRMPSRSIGKSVDRWLAGRRTHGRGRVNPAPQRLILNLLEVVDEETMVSGYRNEGGEQH